MGMNCTISVCVCIQGNAPVLAYQVCNVSCVQCCHCNLQLLYCAMLLDVWEANANQDIYIFIIFCMYSEYCIEYGNELRSVFCWPVAKTSGFCVQSCAVPGMMSAAHSLPFTSRLMTLFCVLRYTRVQLTPDTLGTTICHQIHTRACCCISLQESLKKSINKAYKAWNMHRHTSNLSGMTTS